MQINYFMTLTSTTCKKIKINLNPSMSNIQDAITEYKQKLNEMVQKLEKISPNANDNLKLYPGSHVAENKKNTHLNVCLQLTYNEGKETIILPNTPLPVDLFDISTTNITREQKIAYIKDAATIGPVSLLLLTKDIFTEEDIDGLYRRYNTNERKGDYDIRKIIAFVKTLNIKDFDETKNTKLTQACCNCKNLKSSLLLNSIADVKSILVKNEVKNDCINLYMFLE